MIWHISELRIFAIFLDAHDIFIMIAHQAEYVRKSLVHDLIILLLDKLLPIEDTVISIERLLTGFGISEGVTLLVLMQWWWD